MYCQRYAWDLSPFEPAQLILGVRENNTRQFFDQLIYPN